MAANDIEFKVKPHSHPAIAALAVLALVFAGGSLVLHACPPVPAPAGLPAPVAKKPIAAPAPVPAAEVKPEAPPVAAPAPAPAAVPAAPVASPDPAEAKSL